MCNNEVLWDELAKLFVSKISELTLDAELAGFNPEDPFERPFLLLLVMVTGCSLMLTFRLSDDFGFNKPLFCPSVFKLEVELRPEISNVLTVNLSFVI